MFHHSPTLSRRSLIAIAATLTGGAVIGVRSGIAGQPEVAHRPTGTPATPPSPAASGSILDRAYDPGAGLGSDASTIATFADLDAETAALGLVRPRADADDEAVVHWLRSMTGLSMPQDLAFFRTPTWAESTGFALTQVSQTMEIGEPPDTLAMYSGSFDRESAISTWIDAGYNEIENDGDVAIYSISEDNSFDFTNPIQQMFLARRNNIAIIGDDLVIFATTLELVRNAVESATGAASTLGEAPGVAALVPNTPKLASGAFVVGASLQGLPPDVFGSSPDEMATAIAEQQSAGVMPPIVLALIGVTPGGPMPTASEATPIPTPETATLEISLLMLTADAAQQAIDIAGERLKTAISFRTKQPFTEIFKSWELSVADDAPVARLSITLQDVLPKIWMDMLFSRDLPFLA